MCKFDGSAPAFLHEPQAYPTMNALPSSALSRPPASETTAIDTLRALAIGLVLAHHLYAYGNISIPYLDHNGGLLGVQLFFLISGYLIIQSAQKYSLRVFALHRFFRIFPPYLVALLVFGLGSYVFAPGYRNALNALAPYFLLNLANLQLLHPASVLMLDPLHVGWSLTVELVWYLLAPLAVWWCGSAQGARRRWLLLLLGSMLVGCFWVFAASRGMLSGWYAGMFATIDLPMDARVRHGVVDNAPPAQMMFFVMGACLHVFRAELARLGSWLLWVLAAAILLFVPQWNVALHLFPNPLTGLGLAALFLWVVRSGYGDALTLWLAKVSYSLYLIHAPILLAVFYQLKWTGALGLVTSALLMALGAELGWRCVERPSQALGKRLSARVSAMRTAASVG